MTKPRTPASIDGALILIAATLPGGIAEMAELTRRRPGLVRSWGDPDRREQIPLVDAVQLDCAHRHAGGLGLPLYEVYTARLQAAGLAPCARPVSLVELAADLIRECGEAGAANLLAGAPGATLNARRVAVHEIEQALVLLQRARTVHLEAIEAALPKAAQGP